MQVWLGEDLFFRLFKILGLLYLAGAARAFAADFTLTWDPNSEPTVAGYKVYYGTASQSYLTKIDIGNKTSYTVTVLGAETYYFAVTAYDILGNESGFSNEAINATTFCTTSISPSSRSFVFPGGGGGVAVTAAS